MAGALSKTDGALYTVVISLVLGLGYHNFKKITSAGAFLVPAVLVSASAITVILSSVQTSYETSESRTPWTGSAASLLVSNFLKFPNYLVGALGAPGPSEWRLGLGRFDLPIPPFVWVSGTILIGFLFMVGLGVLTSRKGVALGILVGTLIGLPLVVLQRQHGSPERFLQPRYILPIAVVVLSVALTRQQGTVVDDLTKLQVGFWAASVWLSGVISQHVVIRRYVSGLDISNFNLGFKLEWWWNLPFGPNIVWITGATSFGALISVALFAFLDSAQKDTYLRIKPGGPS